jgi:hypothetical protein
MLPNDPFSRSRLPIDFSRAGRVRLLAEAFQALLNDRMPSPEARLFLASGGMAWLDGQGDLLRDLWRVSGPAGSHNTPTSIWRRISSSRGATDPACPGKLRSVSPLDEDS